jgi:hypothetical protein
VNLAAPKAAAGVELNPRKPLSVLIMVLDKVRGPVFTEGRIDGLSSDGCALCANVAAVSAPMNMHRSATVAVNGRF